MSGRCRPFHAMSSAGIPSRAHWPSTLAPWCSLLSCSTACAGRAERGGVEAANARPPADRTRDRARQRDALVPSHSKQRLWRRRTMETDVSYGANAALHTTPNARAPIARTRRGALREGAAVRVAHVRPAGNRGCGRTRAGRESSRGVPSADGLPGEAGHTAV